MFTRSTWLSLACILLAVWIGSVGIPFSTLPRTAKADDKPAVKQQEAGQEARQRQMGRGDENGDAAVIAKPELAS